MRKTDLGAGPVFQTCKACPGCLGWGAMTQKSEMAHMGMDQAVPEEEVWVTCLLYTL